MAPNSASRYAPRSKPRSLQSLAQHKRQYSAMPEVVDLVGSVDANRGRERAAGTAELDLGRRPSPVTATEKLLSPLGNFLPQLKSFRRVRCRSGCVRYRWGAAAAVANAHHIGITRFAVSITTCLPPPAIRRRSGFKTRHTLHTHSSQTKPTHWLKASCSGNR